MGLFYRYFSGLLGLGLVAEPRSGLHKPRAPSVPARSVLVQAGFFVCSGKTHLIYNELTERAQCAWNVHAGRQSTRASERETLIPALVQLVSWT